MLDKCLNFLERYVTAVLFAGMCVIIFLQVIFRATGISISWTEELARYLFVWIIYLSSSRAMRFEKHLSVDILPIILKEKQKIFLNIFSTLATLVFFIGLVYAGSIVLSSMTVNTQYSPANHINMIIPYAAPTLGTILMIIRAGQLVFLDIKKLKKMKNGISTEEGGKA